MANSDMYVVMYKIIAYLYDCMKRGVEPDESRWNHVAMGIPESYWCQIVDELVSHRLVSGIVVTPLGSELAVMPTDPRVTMEGVAFAQENSMMAKAKQFLMDAKASIPFI